MSKMNNSEAWNCYADEFNECSIFDKTNIHTGLGIPGINPSKIVRSASKILDVGCGNGINTFLMHMVNKGMTMGIDSAQSFINQAIHDYSEHGCSFRHMDFEHFCTYECKSTFNLVTFFGSLDYIELNKSFMNCLNQVTTNSSRCYIAKFHPMWTSMFENDVAIQNTKGYFENGRIDLIKYGRDPVCVL